MFENITDIALSKNIAPFPTNIQDIISSAKQQHSSEVIHLKNGEIGPFTRTLIMQIPIEVHTQEGKSIDIECKIRSRTMQNFINNAIIQNIRSVGNLESLDIDFEFLMGIEAFSEYHFSQEKFYTDIKHQIVQFIKKNPPIEKTIVDNYCDGLSATLGYIKSKEPLIAQWEKTTRELCIILGMPEDFVLQENNKFVGDSMISTLYTMYWKENMPKELQKQKEKLQKIGYSLNWFDAGHEIKRYIDDIKKDNEEIQNIIVDIEKWKQEISLDSKFFFLDNGDNLYDEVIEKSAYNKYYREEIRLIEENKKRIVPYLKEKYIGLWCGNAKKDYIMISDHIDTNIQANESYSRWGIWTVLLMDSSLRSLSKAEKRISKNRWSRWASFGITTVMFSQERIDTLLEDNQIKTLTSVTNNPKESICNIPDIREAANTFTLFGGTFGNFWAYQKKFLQQMNKIMNTGDVLCVSLFNPPKSKEEQEKIIRMYDTPETHIFIKNFFIKLGIPEDMIEVQVTYNDKTTTIHIDAKIHQKNNQSIQIHPTGVDVEIPNDTIFHCITSQRMGEEDLQKCIKNSHTSLKIIDQITTADNPFTLYMISK